MANSIRETEDAAQRRCGSKPRTIGRIDKEYERIATDKYISRVLEDISRVLEVVWALDIQTIKKGDTYVSFQYKCVILRVCSY